MSVYTGRPVRERKVKGVTNSLRRGSQDDVDHGAGLNQLACQVGGLIGGDAAGNAEDDVAACQRGFHSASFSS